MKAIKVMLVVLGISLLLPCLWIRGGQNQTDEGRRTWVEVSLPNSPLYKHEKVKKPDGTEPFTSGIELRSWSGLLLGLSVCCFTAAKNIHLPNKVEES